MARVKRRPQMEFSKRIVIGFLIFAVAILVAAFYLMYKVQDLSALNEIIIGLTTIGTAIFGFYFWKAKAENIVKIHKQYGEEIANKIKEEVE